MNKINIPNLFLLLLILSQQSFAQQPLYLTYDWNQNPEYKSLKFEDKDIMGLKNYVISEFIYNSKNELEQYYLEHKVFWLNSDEKIEDYNKIYLPTDDDSEIVVHKARVVNKVGKVITLGDEQFFNAEDAETKKKYKYFAFEGLEKGSFIEYFYVEKQNPDYNGVKISQQYGFDQQDVRFDLYAPRNLFFQLKNYNGLSEAVSDTLTPKKNHWSIKAPNLEQLEFEEQAANNANKKFLIYKLDRNTYGNKRDISSYSQVSQNIYNYYFKNVSEEEKAAVKQFVQQSFTDNVNTETRIRTVENHLKNNIFFTKVKSPEHQNLINILNKKIADNTGFIKLYVSIFKELGIPMEIVLTSDRSNLKFDPKFEAYNFLNEFLLYFPELNLYTAPTEIESRLGFPPSEYTDNYGLFIKEVILGTFASGVGEIKYIDPVTAEKTYDNILAEITFSPEDLTQTNIHYRREMGGYSVAAFQPYLGLSSQEQKDNIYHNILTNSLSQDIEILEKKIPHEQTDDFGVHPFIIDAQVKSEAFVEKAGNRYVFKIGDLIGQQVEMYEDKNRKQPLEADHQRTYYRIINFDIPDGYQVQNLDDLNIDESYIENGKTLMYFKSSYSVNGNKVSVKADEQYSQNLISLEVYQQYRKVINGAADFNKIKLVLTPK